MGNSSGVHAVRIRMDLITVGVIHCDLKISRSQAKINENFANYFLQTKANNKCFIVLKCTCKELQKSISELER